jgi:hypothetical protein
MKHDSEAQFEKDWRNQLAKEFRAMRKIDRAWAKWYQKYNNELIYLCAGLISFSRMKVTIDEGEAKGWISK